MPELYMHDVRHAAAAGLLRAGVTLAVAAQVLGHSPPVLARRYGHLEADTLRKVIHSRFGRPSASATWTRGGPW
jgi:site-specific recombinase XerD